MNRWLKYVLIGIFAVGAAVRLVDVPRPIDRASWRESDVGAVARNFANESMNIFYPRIDWRGASPGYTEMEFPLYPWVIALTYKAFGVHDVFGRVWAFVFSLVTLAFFFRLARGYLAGPALVAACLFFTFNPLILEFSSAIQPEGLMMLFYVGGVLYFVRWLSAERSRDFWFAAALTALALLTKPTSANIGLLFAFLLFNKFGFQMLGLARVWIFGVTVLLPPVVWSLHANSLWKSYGNSLGVSNEHHLIGQDFFTNPYFAKGILTSELFHVWSVFGLVIGLFAVVSAFRERTVRDSLVWLGGCFVLYIAAARTTADDWAAYYHIFSVAPAALLFGAGIRELSAFARRFADSFSQNSRPALFRKISAISILTLLSVAVIGFDAVRARSRILENRSPDENLVCALKLKPALTAPGPILVSGDRCFDPDGYEVAYNASFMFYWLERKGFNVCAEQQSIANVRAIAAQGAIYFVAQRRYLKQRPEFEVELREAFPVVDECGEFIAFDLRRHRGGSDQ